AAADDDAAHVADLALILTAFVGSRFPTEQRGVERHRLLVIRHLERDVIEPDGLPVRRLERRRDGGLAVGGSLSPIVPAAVADLQIEAVRILHVETLNVFALVIGNRCKAAFAQFRFHLLRVPWFDTPAEIIEYREPRRAWAAGSTATASAPALSCSRRGRGRRLSFGLRRGRLIPAAQDETAPFSDVENGLLAIVAPDFPVHERGVVR